LLALSFLTLIAVCTMGLPFAWIIPVVMLVVQARQRTVRRAALAGLTRDELEAKARGWPFFHKHADIPVVRDVRALLEAGRYDVLLQRWRDVRLDCMNAGDNEPGRVEFTRDGADEELRELLVALAVPVRR